MCRPVTPVVDPSTICRPIDGRWRWIVTKLIAVALSLTLLPTDLVAQTAPRLISATPTPDGLTLEWTPSEADRAYTIQLNHQLPHGLWRLAPSDVPWPITETEVTIPPSSDEETTAARFYRIRTVPTADRGRLISTESLGAMSTATINLLFFFAGISVTPEYPVEVHNLLYETIDPWGGRTVASGTLIYPTGVSDPLPLVCYQHGSVTEITNVPSQSLEQRIPGIGLGTTGYATVLPDLLGLGESPGFHPYHHARSEATAAVDLLRAARAWCATNSVALNHQLFLCGYSQGGHATMALHRELQTYHTTEFTVTAAAPMAGAHDLSGVTLDDFLSGRPLPNPYYVAYLLAAYQDVYQITNSWANWLTEPYATTLPPLLASRAPGSVINAAMPADVTQLFTPEVLEALRTDPNHPIQLALRDNDLYRWKPESPLRMFHCLNDQDVPFANSTVAQASFLALGATEIDLIDPSPQSGHGGCVLPAFLGMKDWFDTFQP